MASYRLLIARSVGKDLEELPAQIRRRVATRIKGLAAEPRPPGAEKLSGREKYRMHQRAYRVLYSIDDAAQTVTVAAIGHRRDVYR